MRKAGEIARRAASQPSTESADSTPQRSKTAAKFWLRMTEIYGLKWTSTAGETPTELWSTAVTALSGDEVRRGLHACLSSGDAWPPSLPQFLSMCRPPRRENAAAYRWQPQLPAPVSEPEKARAELAKIRATLRGAA